MKKYDCFVCAFFDNETTQKVIENTQLFAYFANEIANGNYAFRINDSGEILYSFSRFL